MLTYCRHEGSTLKRDDKPIVDKLITQAELARRAGRSRAAVSKALLRSNLQLAKVGNKIDASHPEAIKFVERGIEADIKKNPHNHRDVVSPYTPTDEQIERTLSTLPADIRKLAHMPLNQLIEMFGTDKSMTEFLKAVKDIESIHKIRLETAEKESRLVTRRLVGLVFDMYDTMFKRLLSDGARTIARKCYAMAHAGQSELDLEEYVIGRLSKFIKNTKAKATKALRVPAVGE